MQPQPFSDGALDCIHHWSGGIPRVINGICDNALISAFGARRRLIDEREILDVVNDLGLRAPAPTIATPPRLPTPIHVQSPARASASPSGLITIPIRDVELDPVPSMSTFDRWTERFKMRSRRKGEVPHE
jgi:hypothetical protein